MRTTAPPDIVAEVARLCRDRGLSVRSLSREARIGWGSAQRILAGEPVQLQILQRAASLVGYQVTVKHTLTKI